jgi:hypothetical protein
MGEIRNAYTILAGKSQWKIPPERPMRRWEDNIKVKMTVFWDGP